MTSTATTLPTDDDIVRSITTAADDFPVAGLQIGPVDPQDSRAELLPTDDAVDVLASIDGAVVAVIVAPALGKAMGVKADDEAGFAAAVAPVVEGLLQTFGTGEGEVSTGRGIDGVQAIRGRREGGTLHAAGIFAGTTHVATLAICLGGAGDDPDPAPAAPAAGGAVPVSGDAPEATAAFPAAAPSGGTGASTGVGGALGVEAARSLHLLREVELAVTAELGRAKMTVGQLLGLVPGSVIELDKAAGTPIDLLVNGTIIARGEVVVIDEEFGVRISEIVDGRDED